MPSKVEQLQAQLREVSSKALALVDDDKKTMKTKAAELAPLEQQIAHLESEIKDYAYVAQKRASLAAGDMGAEGHQIPSELPERRNSSTIAKAWGEKVQTAIEARVRNVGGDTKALINGQIDIPSIIRETTQMPGRPSTILQLIPQTPPRRSRDDSKNDGNVFGYLVQTARNLNAGAVPDGARKPTSGITFEEKEDRYRVYAHLTDPMPKRYLDDYRNLIAILKTQLGLGLIESLERDVLLGTGVKIPEVVDGNGNVTTQGEDPVLGILNTPGILTKAWASGTTPLKQLTSGRYQLEDTFVTPNAWIINSKDYQALVELRENGDTGALLFGTGRTSLDQLLGDYDRIISPLIPQGTALLGDFQQTELIPREDDHLDIDGSGPLFDRNQVKLRHEGRYGFATNQPSAFIKVALKAS